jgi:uncharacterized repeat protein (TIGR02543 family)
MKRIIKLLTFIPVFLVLISCTATYTVSFNSNGGSTIESISVDEGTSVLEPTQPTREGYTFGGWYSDSTLNTSYDFSSPVMGNITLQADWNINQYTFTFDSNDGTNISSITRNYDREISAPYEPTKEGYTFTGWYIDSSLSELYEFTTMPADDMTLYAGWSANEHTLIYKDWDETVLYEDTFEYGTDLSDILVDNPKREGYTFVDWNTDLPETMPNEDIQLEAIYEINQYTITFNSNEGISVESITQDYNTEVLKPNDPTRVGYSFLGWYNDEELTNEYDFNRMQADDITLYAKWIINEYTVKFTNWNGTVLYEEDYVYGSDISGISVNSTTRTGYTYIGWNRSLPNTMPGYDLLIESVYQINKYSIDFEVNGGSPVQRYYLDYNSDIVEPEEPIREGYTFDGWYTTETYETRYIFNKVEARDITLYAKWNINSYTLTYEDEDGTLIKSVVYQYNSSLSEFIIPDNPDKEGFAFTEWDIELPEFMPAYDLIITAQYPFEISVTNEEITIINYVGTDSNVIIFGELEGYPVVNIGVSAFQDENITSITFPSTITTIESNAFRDNSISELVLPEGLTTIGVSAFSNNTLTSVTIPSSLTSIGMYAFRYNKAAMTLILSEGVESIGVSTFQDANITSITFPSTITTIESNAFKDNSISELVLPEGLTTIGGSAFDQNPLTSITIIGDAKRFNSVWDSIGFPENLKLE